MTRAIIYTRFSPRPGADESESCEKQEEVCREYCKRSRYVVAGVFEDRGISGSRDDRPGLWDAVDAMRRGMVLVVRWRSRLARKVYMQEYLEDTARKGGWKIEASEEENGDEPEQVMMRQIIAAFREYERKMVGIRTRRAMLKYQKEGRVMGSRLPYGFRPDPDNPARMVEDLAEQEIIRQIVVMHDDDKGPCAIAAELDLLGHVPRSAEEWDHSVIRAILRRQ